MIALIVIVVLAQTQTPARDTRPTAETGTAAIAGVVTSDEARPVPLRRARVTLSGPGFVAPRTVITTDDGRFLFEGLAAGAFTVAAAKDGFVSVPQGDMRTGRPGLAVHLTPGQRATVGVRLPRGAVITGTVTGVDGLPAAGVPVTALAHRFVGPAGERRFVPAGIAAGTTDDRGIYRIYQLPAGNYVVSAQWATRNVGMFSSEVRAMSDGRLSDARLVLAPVFHPSGTEATRATQVTVRAGEERSGVDIQLQYVPLAAVSGSIPPSASATLIMTRIDEIPVVDAARTARPDAEGRFTFPGVPPGPYRIIARSRGEGTERVGFADVVVNGEDVSGVVMSLQSGLTIAGRIVFEGDKPPVNLPVSLRAPVPLTMNIANAGFVAPALQIDGTTFKMEGIIPGTYRLMGNMQGIRTPIGPWWLKSLVVGGRDILDAPLDLRASADDAVATFTDRASELSGSVKDADGRGVTDAFVVVFATDRSSWFFNSRRVVGLRTDREGRYTLRNLPPGDYRVVATRDLEPNEWFDPAVLDRLLPAGTPLRITGPEKMTTDLIVR